MAGGSEDLGGFIRAQRRAQELSLRRLSEASGISNPYLSQIERGLRRPSADVLRQIARALGLPIEPLYVRAGILEPDRGDLAARIRIEPGLTDQQRNALIDLYVRFREESRDEEVSPAG